jgi:hypothetical protein
MTNIKNYLIIFLCLLISFSGYSQDVTKELIIQEKITFPDNSEQTTAFDQALIPDVSSFATTDQVAAVEALIPDVSSFATTDQVAAVEALIPDVSSFATTDQVAAVEALIPDVSSFATTDQVAAVEGKFDNWIGTNTYLKFNIYAKHHLIDSNVFLQVNTWQDIPFDFSPETENSLGILLQEDNKTISFDFNGHVQIDGCLRPTWIGNDNQGATLYSRIIWTTNNWENTNEARCLQSENSRVRQGGQGDTLMYKGSLTIYTNTQIRLQGRVTGLNLILQGHNVFDNPVAATINIFGVIP